MTPKEWTAALYAALKKCGQVTPVYFQVEELVEKAVKEERERCAKIAEAGSLGLCNCEVNRYATMIAGKIRGSSNI